MTVKEMRTLVDGSQTFVLLDDASGVQVFSEAEANNSDNPNVVATRWKHLEKYDECEVTGLRTHSDSEVAFYINAPTRHFETWLDVTYSLRIRLDVPYGKDENKAFEEYGDKILNNLPKTITINDNKWDYGYDNMDSGNFYDCIEEVVQ